MAMKHIEITIDADGGVEVEAFGFKGQGCAAEVDVFSKALGKTIETKKKSEAYIGEPERIKVGWKK